MVQNVHFLSTGHSGVGGQKTVKISSTNFSRFKEYFFIPYLFLKRVNQKDYLPSNRAEQALDDTRIPYLLPSLPLFL